MSETGRLNGGAEESGGTGDGGQDEAYDPQEQRARVRERVREFEEEIIRRWTGPVPVPDGLKHNSSLDAMMRHRSLNAFRHRWFTNYTAFPLLVTMLVFGALFAVTSDAGVLATIRWAGATDNFPLALGAVAVVSLLSSFLLIALQRTKLEKEDSEYAAAIRELALEIEVAITSQLNTESARVSESSAKVRATVSTQEDKASVRSGIIDTMRSWRRLERLPYYLRHAWDQYYNDICDDRQLPPRRNPRIFKFWAPLFWLAGLCAWSMYDLAFVLLPQARGLDSAASNAPYGLILLFISLAAFYSSLFVYRRWVKEEWFLLELPLTLVIVLFTVMMGVALSADGELAGRAASLLVAVGAVTIFNVLVGFYFAISASNRYKRTSKQATARIVLALKSHKKSDVVAMHDCKTVTDFLVLAYGRGKAEPTWNGWTTTYEEERRQILAAEGVDRSEIEIKLAVDPVIYVGERQNRRIEVCQFDPTPAFLNAIPEVRTVG